MSGWAVHPFSAQGFRELTAAARAAIGPCKSNKTDVTRARPPWCGAASATMIMRTCVRNTDYLKPIDRGIIQIVDPITAPRRRDPLTWGYPRSEWSLSSSCPGHATIPFADEMDLMMLPKWILGYLPRSSRSISERSGTALQNGNSGSLAQADIESSPAVCDSAPRPADYVVWAYRLLLGRDPENEAEIQNYPWTGDPRQLVRSVLSSSEFRQKNRDLHAIIWGEALLPHFPAIPPEIRNDLIQWGDPVRTCTLALALQTVRREHLAGAMAEVGVYRGDTAVLYNRILPEKQLFLFDTFGGFPDRDLDGRADERFADTSLEAVTARFDTNANVVFRKGYFPETAAGLENEKFCFVMLDADLYNPTLAGLQWFYDRMVPGGYIVAHDYSSYESDRAVSRAFDVFMHDKPERVIEIPDEWGTVLFRKV